jgi:hypothetical protein
MIDGQAHWGRLNLFSSPEPTHGRHDPHSPILFTAVRDLANDNVITAVMLTGVMLLQVCTASSFQYYRQRYTSHSLHSASGRELEGRLA